MLSRVEALEELLRQDDTSVEESFDYDSFLKNRNEVPTQTPKVASIEELEASLARETNAKPGKNVVDSDESDAESDVMAESDHEAAQSEPETLKARKTPQSRRVEILSDDERDEQPLAKEIPAKSPRKRASRAHAEQELARMKRQLDKDIEVHVKAKPTLSTFLNNFTKHESTSDIDLDSDVETCPTSPTVFPVKITGDKRKQWLADLYMQHDQQETKRANDNSKEFMSDSELEIDEEKPVDKPEDRCEGPFQDTQPQDPDEGSEAEIINSDYEEQPNPLHDSSPPQQESQGTTQDSVQPTIAETQVEPIDTEALRKLYVKQRKVFNDSDSESDGEDVNANLMALDHNQRAGPHRDLAYELFEEQAQESDEDDLQLAHTDDDDDNDESPVENLIDDTAQKVEQDKLRAMFVEKERVRDEQLTKVIQKDVVGGGWRTKKLYNEAGMLSDEDEDDDERRPAKRRQRERLLEHSTIGRLAANEKTKAFAESMMEELMTTTDTLEDDSCHSIQESLKFLDDDGEVVFSQNQNVHNTLQSQQQSHQSQSAEAFNALPVVVAVKKSTIRSTTDSAIYKPLPSVHAAPVLSSKHVPRRARISAITKKPTVAGKAMGWGYKQGFV